MGISRRSFLVGGGAAVAAAVALDACSSSKSTSTTASTIPRTTTTTTAIRRVGQRPDPSKPEGTDLIPQIEHVLVLMMENHSYDNYFGVLAGRGDGLTLGRRQADRVEQGRRRQGRPDVPHGQHLPAATPSRASSGTT